MQSSLALQSAHTIPPPLLPHIPFPVLIYGTSPTPHMPLSLPDASLLLSTYPEELKPEEEFIAALELF